MRVGKEISRYLVCFIKPKFKILRSLLAFSILSGTLFVPARVEAGLISSIFGSGSQVFAQAGSESDTFPKSDSNSQNIALLQANVSSASIFQNKNDSNKEDEISSGSDVSIMSDLALLSGVGPMGVSNGKEIVESSLEDVSIYVVRKGDSLSEVADMFEVSVNTILWANDLKKGDKIKEGDVLFILPVSGVKHTVTKGQTLKSISQKYKADILDVASFNGISVNAELAIGDELMIPDGEISVDGPVKTTPKAPTKNTKPQPKNIAGYFINPVPSAIRTQGLHGKNAVDLAAPIGTPIYAAASGTVLLARMGWNGAYGNMVVIQHPNGTKTLYSHLFELNTTTGRNVSQGEVIGYVGNSGRVRSVSRNGSGAHLHFEVYGAKNPGVDKSWAR